MLRGMPWKLHSAKVLETQTREKSIKRSSRHPLTGSAGFAICVSWFSGFTWIGLRPDWSAERVGEQYLSAEGGAFVRAERTERAIQPALPVLDSEHRQFRALTDVMAAEQNTLVDEAVHVRREHLPAAAQAQRWWERNEQRRSKEQRRRRGRVCGRLAHGEGGERWAPSSAQP